MSKINLHANTRTCLSIFVKIPVTCIFLDKLKSFAWKVRSATDLIVRLQEDGVSLSFRAVNWDGQPIALNWLQTF